MRLIYRLVSNLAVLVLFVAGLAFAFVAIGSVAIIALAEEAIQRKYLKGKA